MSVAILEKFENLQLFTEQEAWTLFRTAALSEAVGWSLLGTSVLFGAHIPPGHGGAVKIAGQIHGTIFMAYLGIVGATYASLGWSRKRTIIALAASVPPFGTFVFEQWAAYKRRGEALKHRREMSVRGIISDKDLVLAMQTKDANVWQLPGGQVPAHESAETALARLVHEQTGVTAQLGQLAFVVQTRRKNVEHIELYFYVTNSGSFSKNALLAAVKNSKTVDELRFINPAKTTDLKPDFLQHEPLGKLASKLAAATKIITISE